MDHNAQTAAGLTTWIALRKPTPTDLEAKLLAALRDAEERGLTAGQAIALASTPALACPGCASTTLGSYCLACKRHFLAADLVEPADPAPEPVEAVERPLNARMGRRWMVGANGLAPRTIDLSGLYFYGDKKRGGE